jgi:hypothetical protein
MILKLYKLPYITVRNIGLKPTKLSTPLRGNNRRNPGPGSLLSRNLKRLFSGVKGCVQLVMIRLIILLNSKLMLICFIYREC